MNHRLKTLGHATMLLLEGDKPLVATDPWLIGSTYWRSWWLEKYPSAEEFDEVKSADYIYVTHSHPDHFHYPTLRALGKPKTLHPQFPRYEVTGFLASEGYPVAELPAWQWVDLGKRVRIASIPTPIDDSILLVETPDAYVANLNDSVPRLSLLKFIRREMLESEKPLIMLKSYSPASIASSIYRNGMRTQMKTKRDYAETAMKLARTLGATHFVPFASQAFFNRTDSTWANEYKVTYEDLKKYWNNEAVALCPPFVDIDLRTLAVGSTYASACRSLNLNQRQQVQDRERDEKQFEMPLDFQIMLKKYMSELYFLSLFFRRGIGWRLSTSGREFFFNTRTGELDDSIPEEFDVSISLPDKVIYESLQNNVLTDLGITMFIKVESKVSNRFTYGLFLLMGLHDYGYFNNWREFTKFVRFYLPYFIPVLMKIKWALTRQTPQFQLAIDN
ncbi:MAG: MBL fold metallo-hydrolase [Pyrinomonadaceae bacterium]